MSRTIKGSICVVVAVRGSLQVHQCAYSHFVKPRGVEPVSPSDTFNLTTSAAYAHRRKQIVSRDQ